MTRADLLDFLLHLLIFLLGSGIGSFLNVVIYRLPLGLSVNDPKRSFCFSCKKQIPWYRNLPLITWVVQRGKCANCGAKIAFRYFFVELLTGCLFYAAFLKYGTPMQMIAVWGPMVLCYWVFIALLVAGTFIDLDHYILPFEITISGIVAGLLGSFWVPQLMGEATHARGLLLSFVSAGLAFGGLWMVVELGKLAFGRLKHKYEKPTPWTITQPDENEPPILTVGEEKISWLEIFTRDSDRMVITCESAIVNEHTFGAGKVEVKLTGVRVLPKQGEPVSFKIEIVKKLEGVTTEVVVPREAMGFGDTVLLAMIGAFLGWKAILFTLLAASAIGSLFGLVPRLFGKTEWTAKIPFGPYLSAGALIWLFWGAQILEWYTSKMGWQEPAF
jgi:leader peptidase (prepilin peptidase)/N-methyltransferase